ncbi:lysylphosphatidylglycerol synthase domain-containing protein, partial [Clostridium perfringens]|nr:lysylphosphatidylglycerol synthase domain-containing protein [Clostridium perfringens]
SVAGALALSLVFNLLQVGWNVALARGLGLDLPLPVFLVFVPLTAVALLLPAFGGLGVRELSYVNLFARAGVTPALAVALSFSVYLITLATGLVGG